MDAVAFELRNQNINGHQEQIWPIRWNVSPKLLDFHGLNYYSHRVQQLVLVSQN